MKENKRIEYCHLLAKLRIYNNMTQKQLADKCGLQQSTIARIESGKVNPGLDTLLIIENALNFERVYINKNKILMGTVSFMFGSTNNKELCETMKKLPCFSLVELSSDKSNVTAVWNEEYVPEFTEDEDQRWDEIAFVMAKTEWCDGDPEDYPDGAKVWWFEERFVLDDEE